MYHVACKVEFQPFNQSYSQLTFFIFLKILRKTHGLGGRCDEGAIQRGRLIDRRLTTAAVAKTDEGSYGTTL